MLTVMLVLFMGAMAIVALLAFGLLVLTILAHIFEAMDEYREYKNSQK